MIDVPIEKISDFLTHYTHTNYTVHHVVKLLSQYETLEPKMKAISMNANDESESSLLHLVGMVPIKLRTSDSAIYLPIEIVLKQNFPQEAPIVVVKSTEELVSNVSGRISFPYIEEWSWTQNLPDSNLEGMVRALIEFVPALYLVHIDQTNDLTVDIDEDTEEIKKPEAPIEPSNDENIGVLIQMPECPVCLEKYKSNDHIYQCRKGHFVCGSCRDQIKSCPLCRGQIIGRCHDFEKHLQAYGQQPTQQTTRTHPPEPKPQKFRIKVKQVKEFLQACFSCYNFTYFIVLPIGFLALTLMLVLIGAGVYRRFTKGSDALLGDLAELNIQSL